ncbi:Pre-mRNA-splicing factor SPF27-like protein [Golovinomyces cichoracearum]|uniref:Pre-mRNA-splicing factor SPF27-like protein n=1 Tax=Golovinomyces cichoracearum TaxID=62708 RepID=A0A420J3F6_9PEZI|nr:Pre-mRNA-splicing factor SPF27-like protein [Golovinomyces cichoracearum]RKF81285.1 Pre-mRNA-splicing factor SPF27-like protein [Golovinomyces cichoracearum]
MSLTTAVFDSLPYIENDLTPDERIAAESLIAVEMGEKPADGYPSLPPLPLENFSPMMQAEIERIQNKQPLKAIDLSRYETSDTPIHVNSDQETWCAALRSAYISQSYLSSRKKNLESLDKYGKNVWLLGNAQLESILRDLERDLAERKSEIDTCVIERKKAQESIGGEIKSLEENWKRGLGRAIETEIAADNLKFNYLETQ